MLKTILTVPVLLSLGLLGSSAAGHVVTQKDKKFSQSRLEIRAGDTVEFRNDDAVTHNVFSTSAGHAFNLKTQAPGTAGSHTFTRAGTAEVRCAFHPVMKLTVVVK